MPDTPQKPLNPFFQRYMSSAPDRENRFFASALNRYLSNKYALPESTSPGGRGAFGTAIKAGLLVDPTRAGYGGLPGINVALDEIMSSLLGTPSALSKITPPGEIDITDPSVELAEGTKLGPLEKFLRSMRIVARSLGVGMSRGASIAPGTGLNLAYEEGELARPKNHEEAMLHTIGAMLAGAVPFAGASALAPAATEVAGGIGQGVRSVARAAGMDVAEAAPSVASGAGTSLLKGLAADAAIGGVYGATEAATEGSLTRATGEGENAPDILKSARDYAIFGLGLGALFRIPTSTTSIRFVRSILNREPPIQGVDIAPGVIHDGIRSEMVNGKLRFRRVGMGTWISAEQLTPENLDSFRKLSAQRARDIVSDTPAAQATEAAVAQTTPNKPETLPNDIATPEGLAMQNTYGGMYLRRAEALVRNLGKEKVERQLDELRKVLWSDAPVNERLSVGGRVVALENALGRGTRLPGQLPVELEAQAIETVAGLRPYGRAQIEQAAVDAALNGRTAYANRLRSLIDSDLPETYSREINTRLAKVNTQLAKGVRAGTVGIVDGRPVEILQRPKLGLAWAKHLDEANPEPFNVDVNNFKPFPKAGQMAALEDGRVVKVKAVDPQKGMILIDVDLKKVPFEEGAPLPGWISINDVKEVAASRSSFRSLENQRAALLEEFKPTEPIDKPIPAVTETGEPVSVEGIGPEAVKVRTKSGRVKTMPRSKVSAVEPAGTTQRITQDLDALAISEAQKAGRTVAGAFDSEAEAVAHAKSILSEKPAVGKVQDRFYVTVPEEGTISKGNPLSQLDDQIATHNLAIAAANKEIGTFVPGKVPSEGNRIRFFRVAPKQREAFENAWREGKKFSNYIVDGRYGVGKGGKKVRVIQMHVLPQPTQSGDILYAIELPEHVTPKKDYYASANEALQAIGGKRRINTYASVVDVSEDVFSTGQISRVPESLRNSSIRPQELLRDMTQEEQTEYLRHLLVFNENIPSEVAEPIVQAREARTQIADAASVGDGPAVVQAEQKLEESHVKAAEALENVRAENNRPAYNQLVTDLQSGDELAPAREAFELEGLTDKTKGYYFKQLEGLPIAQAGDPARDALIANSLNVEGQRAFIAKYERPYVEYGQPGITKPAGETQPAGLPFYEVEFVDPDGLTIRGATKRFETPAEVGKYLNSEGFAPTLYKTHAGEYYHESNPALTAVVQPSKEGHGATMTIKEIPAKEAETGFTPEQEELLVEFRELHRESASNGPQWKVVAQRKFKTAAAAGKFLEEKGFQRKPAVPDLTARFKSLPPMSRIEAVAKGEAELASHAQRRKLVLDRINKLVNAKQMSKEQGALELHVWDRENGKLLEPGASKEWAASDYMGNVEENLNALLRAYSKQTGRVPEAVQAYAQEFSQHYYKVTGKPPFSKQIRLDVVGMPHTSDYGPESGMGSSLAGQIEDAHAYGEAVDRELPESVREVANIRVGKSMQQMAKAAEEMATGVTDRPAPGLFETQQWLINELMSTAEILNTSRDIKAVEGAQARMNELRRTVIAYEKLRNRVRPTSMAMGGEVEEADMISRAERALRRRGAKIKPSQTASPLRPNPRKLTELDLLPANEEVMRILSQVGEGTDAIAEGPHGEQYVATLPHDYETGGHIFYPNVLGISTLSKSDVLETAARVSAAQKQQTLWAEAAMKTQRIIPEPAKFDLRTDLNLVRY